MNSSKPVSEGPTSNFRQRYTRAPLDEEYKTLVTELPAGIRDFRIHRQIDKQTFAAQNPLELLNTKTAVNVLEQLRKIPGANPNSWVLSRLLVQCVGYSRAQKHLVADYWDESTLRGDKFTVDTQSALALDLKSAQSHDFEVVRSACNSDFKVPADYWGTFSRLPPVADEFQDRELDSFCDQLLQRLTQQLNPENQIEISDLRKTIDNWWNGYFEDFQLSTKRRDRRMLFKRLMSVAIRQVSSMTEQIAHAIVLRDASFMARMTSLFQCERERRLFNLRYGACEALGGINIGFLYDCGDLHAELVNNLASALVTEHSDKAWQAAELQLRKHVYLLGKSRERSTQIESDRKRQQRAKFAGKSPGKSVQPENHCDKKAIIPGGDDGWLGELRERKDAILPLLKVRDRAKVEAVLKCEGDFTAAAAELCLARKQLMRQWRETVLPNIQKTLQNINTTEH